MSFFPWSEEYSVHLRVIDNDHKDLVDTVNALHDGIKGGSARDKIGQIIGNLARYVDDHFVREEGLMEAYSYPNLAQHKRLRLGNPGGVRQGSDGCGPGKNSAFSARLADAPYCRGR